MTINRFNTFMLIDDNKYDNFYHERVIKNSAETSSILKLTSAGQALEYFGNKSPDDGDIPDVIFLDLNMPGMNGWEFLAEFSKFRSNVKCPRIVVLTSSLNPDDMQRSKQHYELSDYVVKPLTKNIVKSLIDRFTNERPEFLLF